MVAPLLVLHQILTAGNTITAFSLLLYGLTFNLRERVARALSVLMACVTIAYFGDVLVATSALTIETETWLRLQWVGISFVPAAYLQLSDALLEATGRPSRGRRSKVVWLSYVLGALSLIAATMGRSLAGSLTQADSVPYLAPGPLFPVFTLFLLVTIGFASLNFYRAYQRCLTRSSRRRMRYLMAGSLGPLLGSFPFLMLGGRAIVSFPMLFWGIQIIINAFVTIQMVLMAYAVAYFGVDIPDRVVKSRLFQWILRGPVVASTVLAITVVVNRVSVLLGYENSRAVPFAMVASLLLLQYLITLIRRPIERWFFYGEDRGDVAGGVHLSFQQRAHLRAHAGRQADVLPLDGVLPAPGQGQGPVAGGQLQQALAAGAEGQQRGVRAGGHGVVVTGLEAQLAGQGTQDRAVGVHLLTVVGQLRRFSHAHILAAFRVGGD